MAIQILSPDVVNQIAAGEVLERPANLLKELIENSIDAGATQIEIDLDDGGRYVRIQDDGSGMEKEDLEKSTLRHATSKIQNFSDLWSLSSYGFRGEALASVAAVSQMTIQSRTPQKKQGLVFRTEFGKPHEIIEQSAEVGTTITIEKLFENVPARLKFLKSESAEITQMIKMIKAFALSHPEVAFKVRSKNILKLFYPKSKSYLERTQVVLEEAELFEAQTNGSQSVRALFSSPQNVNRTAQNIWIFVQKRWIQDRALQKAILDSYQNLLMHGEYPSAVVHLDCDPQSIDVNIHPTKSQVKFQDPSNAFRNVYYTLRDALEKAPWLKNLFESTANPAETEFSKLQNASSVQNAVESYSQNNQTDFAPYSNSFSSAQFKTKSIEIPNAASPQQDHDYQPTIKGVGLDPHWGNLQVLGQLNQTYILAQSRTAMFLVDQHASHERVMFEKLMKSWKNNQFEVQNYLLPLTIDLSSDKMESLLKFQDDFKKMGIELEPSSLETVSVYSAPSFIKEKALSEAITQMAQDILDMGGGFQLQKKIADVFATMACHSAIRAGQALSNEEMTELLKQMDEFPLSSFCPHGRPVFKQITFYELDKDFGRIV